MNIATMNATIARQVALVRESKNMTQAEVAREVRERFGLRFQQTILQRIEDGRRDVRADEVFALADVLGVPFMELIGGTGPDSARGSLIEIYGTVVRTRDRLLVDLLNYSSEVRRLGERVTAILAQWGRARRDEYERDEWPDDIDDADKELWRQVDALNAMFAALHGVDKLHEALTKADFYPEVMVADAKAYGGPVAAYVDGGYQAAYEERVLRDVATDSDNDV